MQQNPSAKTRVIIADDITETRDNLAKLLFFENDIEVVGSVGDGQQAINLAKRLEPDVVLMDINMPNMDGIAATETISAEVPGTSVVMMSVQGDQDYLRRSMLAGAREFLVKPFTGEELATAIRRVHQLGANRRVVKGVSQVIADVQKPGRPQTDGQIFSVFSPKGGVGVTTVAANLAIALRQSTGKSVGLLDGNLMFGDIGVMMNILDNKTISDVVTRIDEVNADTLGEYVLPHSSGVEVLLAPPRPQLAELITAEHIRTILTLMRSRYDYIVVDTWPSFQDITLSMLDYSEKILLITTLEMTSVKNVKLFLDVSELLGYKSEKIELVVNQADGKLGIQPKDIEESLRKSILLSLPADTRAVAMSINQGVPLMISGKDHQFSKAIGRLAGLILQGAPEAEKAEKVKAPKFGLMSRLKPASR
jgi:pilus assembly protein CpaE